MSLNQPEWMQIEGWLTLAEGTKLQELAKGAAVLEIGSYCGRSTVCMAETAASIVSIDPHDSSAIEPYPRKNTFGTFALNIAGLQCEVTPIVSRFEDVYRFLAERSFDLVFIDGDHSYEACRRDLQWAARLVRPHGHVVVHDYGTGYPQLQEVTKAVRDEWGPLSVPFTVFESLAIRKY